MGVRLSSAATRSAHLRGLEQVRPVAPMSKLEAARSAGLCHESSSSPATLREPGVDQPDPPSGGRAEAGEGRVRYLGPW
jgi:hypothetical protein